MKKSWEEIYFEWYLTELKSANYISSWEYQPESWILFEKATYIYEKKLVTKIKQVMGNIPGLPRMEYTADFRIEWNRKAKGIFWQEIYGGEKLTPRSW